MLAMIQRMRNIKVSARLELDSQTRILPSTLVAPMKLDHWPEPPLLLNLRKEVRSA